MPNGGQWRVAGWALRESRSRKGGATRGETRRGFVVEKLTVEKRVEKFDTWRNAQERLTGVGWRGEGPSEEEALAGELDPARGLGRPAKGGLIGRRWG